VLVTSCFGALVLVVLLAAYRARRLLILTVAAVAVGLLVSTTHDTLQTLLTHTLAR
jgi:predicted MFS family arabinose efflux permease